MSIEAMTHVWANTTYPPAQSYILQAIADVVNDTHDNRLFMKVETLAKKTKCSERTIQRALRQFEADGWLFLITDGQGRGTPNEYQFNFIKGDNLADQERVTNFSQMGDNGGSERVTNGVSIPLLELNNNSRLTQYSEEVILLGNFFANSVSLLTKDPFKAPSKAWLTTLDRMIRLDGRTAEQIRNATLWCHADPFWGPNILSPNKLRLKWTQITLKAKQQRAGSGFQLMQQEYEKEVAQEAASLQKAVG